MRFSFTELPGRGERYLRPVVPVVVEGLPRAPLACLLDTGALQNRFGLEIARRAGIDLTGAERSEVAVGGIVVRARTVPVVLTIGDVTWEADVGFCEPWPFAFQLLGQEGFFRWFGVELRAAVYSVELTPEEV